MWELNHRCENSNNNSLSLMFEECAVAVVSLNHLWDGPNIVRFIRIYFRNHLSLVLKRPQKLLPVSNTAAAYLRNSHKAKTEKKKITTAWAAAPPPPSTYSNGIHSTWVIILVGFFFLLLPFASSLFHVIVMCIHTFVTEFEHSSRVLEYIS